MTEDTRPLVEMRSQTVRYNPKDLPQSVEDRLQETVAGNIESTAMMNEYIRIGHFERKVVDEVHDFGDEETGPIEVDMRVLTLSALYRKLPL